MARRSTESIRKDLAPQSGHVSNFRHPIGSVIEPMDGFCSHHHWRGEPSCIPAGHPVWTRLELTKGTQDSAQSPNIGKRYAALHGLYKNHPAPRGRKAVQCRGQKKGIRGVCSCEKTLLPSTGSPRDHCNWRCPIAHNLSLLRPRSTGFILRIRPAINAS